MPYTDESKWSSAAVEHDHAEALLENHARERIHCGACRKLTERRKLDSGFCGDCIERAALDVLEVVAIDDDTDARGLGIDELVSRARNLPPSRQPEIRYRYDALVRG
jgi:hypothetical protein